MFAQVIGVTVGVANLAFIWIKRAQIESAYKPVRVSPIIGLAGVLVILTTLTGKPNLTSACAVASVGVALGWIDAETRRLPSLLTLILSVEVAILGLAAALGFFGEMGGRTGNLGPFTISSMLIGAGIWLVFTVVGRAVGAIGTGDVLLAPALGFFCGGVAAFGLVIALFLAGIYALIERVRGKRKIPFAPALLGGAYLSWLLWA